MATEEEKVIEQFRLLSLEFRRLAEQLDLSNPLPGPEIASWVESAGKIVNALSESDLAKAPPASISGILSALSQLNSALTQVASFNALAMGPQAHRRRNDISQELLGAYQRLFEHAGPILAFQVATGNVNFLAQERLTFTEASQRANEVVTAAMGSIKAAEEEFQSRLKAIQGMEAAAREATRKIGVSEHAVHFDEEAKRHQLAAFVWLGASVLIAGGIAYLGFWFWNTSMTQFELPPGPIDSLRLDYQKFRALHFGLAKLGVLSLCITVVLWTGRIYRANRHNAIVNRHRETALRTFSTFVSSADNETKNAVLLQATQCIFAPQATGFSTHEPDTAPPQRIMEIFSRSGDGTKA